MPAPAPDTDPRSDTELAAEQAHLAESRAQLARMRERTASMDSAAAGDWVSREYLESTFALRMKQLADDPTIPLFFGRLDYRGRRGLPHRPPARLRRGRRADGDRLAGAGQPAVLPGQPDRADGRRAAPPVRLPAGPADGVRGRGPGRAASSRGALRDPRGRDRAAARRADARHRRHHPARAGRHRPLRPVADTICVQGAPGTGKTAVGLHRAAYLLYAHREQLTRQGVLVVGPNASFLRYIGDVLPALGEIDARQTTIEELAAATLAGLQPRNADPRRRRRRRRDAQGRRADGRGAASARCGRTSAAPTEGLVVPARRAPLAGARRTRPRRWWRRCARAASGTAPPGRCCRSRWRTGSCVQMELAGDSPDDRVQDAVARSKPVKDYAKQLWPAVDPARLLWRLLSEPDFLAEAADGILDPDEQAALLWAKPPALARRGPLVAGRRRTPRRGGRPGRPHPVAGAHRGRRGAGPVADDAARAGPAVLDRLAHGARRPRPGAPRRGRRRTWAEALAHLGKPDAHVEELTRGFRVPGDVIEYAARLLPQIAPGLTPPTSVRRARGDLAIVAGGRCAGRRDGGAGARGRRRARARSA